MKVFLDTNVFYNDWYLRNANFKYLFHFLNNEDYEVLLSTLVIEESENIRKREVLDKVSSISRSLNSLKKLSQETIDINLDKIVNQKYDLVSIFTERCDRTHLIKYEDISQSEVVARALESRKPFQAEEKGFRDTLIWLSLLDHLVSNNIEGEVIFISNNKNDFYSKSSEGKISFKKELLEDIESRGVKANIKPYLSLHSFVSDNIDKKVHAVDNYKILDEIESELIFNVEDYLQGFSNLDLADHFENKIFEIGANHILGLGADTFEGLEDGYVNYSHLIKGDEVLIDCNFNLRRVTFEVSIPTVDYILHKFELDKMFHEIDIDESLVTLITVVRPYINATFIYNTKTKDVYDFAVSESSFLL